ncbi:sensor histidine kinase [Herbaspirillum chlorophenolicum]|uniref:sensor histidine kinase n=1 Tax=Herbaspirillum chlorophenolicum TaxID=211589 RepID=UPI000A478EBC|nr:sensor histidine kinase [Herbaspirillum chlorophenolicum]
MTSLRSQLLLWLLFPLGIFVAVSSWITYRNAVDMATATHDRLLLGSARVIAEQIRYDDGVFLVPVPPSALELFQSSAHDRVFYRITSASGNLLAGSEDLPLPAVKLGQESSYFFSTEFRGEKIRVSAYGQSVITAPDDEMVIVEVAQTLRAHKIFSDRIWEHAVLQHLLILLFVAVLLALGVRSALAPAMRLRDHMQHRKPDSLEPLSRADIPDELVPIVDAVNHYVVRLDKQMAAHSRFIANASHQLRTPITVLATQVDYGLHSDDASGKDVALRAMKVSLQHGIRLVNQLLSLSGAEAASDRRQDAMLDNVDLVLVVQEVFEEFAMFAQDKRIDLGFDCAHGSITAQGGMYHELIANLVDNALRYTPRGGVVTTSLDMDETKIVLMVADNGPGIPAEERQRVFERFYRISSSQADGTGLGLAIVAEIAAVIGAQVVLSAPAGHSGLIVTVAIPVAGH